MASAEEWGNIPQEGKSNATKTQKHSITYQDGSETQENAGRDK